MSRGTASWTRAIAAGEAASPPVQTSLRPVKHSGSSSARRSKRAFVRKTARTPSATARRSTGPLIPSSATVTVPPFSSGTQIS
ncbi:hypothetical protein EES47_07110 [Streptomyces sp. ADI98-12]|nr:hypothetical protein EES47_07110 [Streptomyces sp. ADI98-12]